MKTGVVRFVPIRRAVRPAEQKAYDHLSDIQLEAVGEFQVTSSLEAQLGSLWYACHGSGLYNRSHTTYINPEAYCWFVSCAILEARFFSPQRVCWNQMLLILEREGSCTMGEEWRVCMFADFCKTI